MGEPILRDDLFSRLADLDRRLRALEASPQLTQSSIKDGALTVVDSSNITRVKVGKDGSDFDVKVFDGAGANAVALSTLAFGPEFAQILTIEATTSSAITDLATVGPSVTVIVGPSGRVIIQAGAQTFCSDTGVSATTHIDRDAGAEVIAFTQLEHNFGGSGAISAHRARLFEGLTPGSHTFKMRYSNSNGVTSVEFGPRWILAIPY